MASIDAETREHVRMLLHYGDDRPRKLATAEDMNNIVFNNLVVARMHHIDDFGSLLFEKFEAKRVRCKGMTDAERADLDTPRIVYLESERNNGTMLIYIFYTPREDRTKRLCYTLYNPEFEHEFTDEQLRDLKANHISWS